MNHCPCLLEHDTEAHLYVRFKRSASTEEKQTNIDYIHPSYVLHILDVNHNPL